MMKGWTRKKVSVIWRLVIALSLLGLVYESQAGIPVVPTLLGEGESIVSLSAFPSTIQLDSGADAERIIIVATTSEGLTRDVTAEAKLAFANEGIARVETG